MYDRVKNNAKRIAPIHQTTRQTETVCTVSAESGNGMVCCCSCGMTGNMTGGVLPVSVVESAGKKLYRLNRNGIEKGSNSLASTSSHRTGKVLFGSLPPAAVRMTVTAAMKTAPKNSFL